MDFERWRIIALLSGTIIHIPIKDENGIACFYRITQDGPQGIVYEI